MKRLDVLKCDKCGNIVEVLVAGKGEIGCCGEPMHVIEEKTADSTTEKHVPLVHKTDNGYKVVVGSTLHPMTEAHQIQWVELVTETGSMIQFLDPTGAPEADFVTDRKAIFAREYCNLHSLWRAEI